MPDEVLKGQKFEISAQILEMSATPTISVPYSPGINIQAITSDDPDPKFVILEICRTTISKTNNRRYHRANMIELANLTAGVQGFLGHPNPAEYGFGFREPHNIYVGAAVEDLPNGDTRCLAKTYLFRTSPLREWVPKSIAAGRPMTVSINATGDVMRLPDGTLDVLTISELESIDWANPGTEGIGTAQALSVVSEMQGNNESNGGNKTMERDQVVKGVTLAELRAYNSDVVSGVIKGLTISELQSVNPELFGKIAETGKITEIQLTIDGATKMVPLSDVQGIINTKDVKISELQNSITSQKLTEYKNKKLAEQVPEAIREQVAKRVTGNTEAEIDASISGELAYIQELRGGISIPRGNPPRSGENNLAEQFKAMFALDRDGKKA